MRFVITGSRGLLGRYVTDYIRRQSHDLLEVDIVGRGDPDRNYRVADLTDLGQTYDVVCGAEAVIHLAAIPDQRMAPAVKTFIDNLSMTYNVLFAAAQLGVKRVVIASSIQVLQTSFNERPIRYLYLPADEEHPIDPQNEYALSKAAGELAADLFARCRGLTVVSLRFPWIVPPDEPTRSARLKIDWNDTHSSLVVQYVDARDAARACFLAATTALPPNSHHVLYIAAPDTCVDTPSSEIARRLYPEAEVRPELRGFASFVSSRRAAQVLGFVAEFGWQAGRPFTSEGAAGAG
ncbi:MAG: NAD(P)-dependent oxidoreductase [Anaerolineae bacterium]|nr:NAD(P)-dependent oxidoreductase [Thermoflexales bacterium]MDW8406308.1 NAD(P)-dependent oxidoreductase [Anaerolineae bacterium]